MSGNFEGTLDSLGDYGEDLAQRASRQAGEIMPQIDGYQPDSILGKGAFGVCWSATHQRTGQRVAIKVLQVASHKDPAQVAAEIRHMVQVGRHPHVLEVLDARVEGRTIQIVSPLCVQSLGQRMRSGPIESQQLLVWLKQTAQALQLIHKSQLVHCDIKPDNLLLDASGRILVADLGQTRAQGEEGLRSGTFFYMPSQQALENRPDPAWDVYALGATFYQVLTGALPRSQAPWVGQLQQGTPAQRMEVYALNLERTPLREMPDSVPEELQNLLEWLLEINPRHRCPDMASLLERLGKHERTPGASGWSSWLLPLVACLGLVLLPILAGQLIAELGWWLALSIGVVGRIALFGLLVGAISGALLAGLARSLRKSP